MTHSSKWYTHFASLCEPRIIVKDTAVSIKSPLSMILGLAMLPRLDEIDNDTRHNEAECGKPKLENQSVKDWFSISHSLLVPPPDERLFRRHTHTALQRSNRDFPLSPSKTNKPGQPPGFLRPALIVAQRAWQRSRAGKQWSSSLTVCEYLYRLLEGHVNGNGARGVSSLIPQRRAGVEIIGSRDGLRAPARLTLPPCVRLSGPAAPPRLRCRWGSSAPSWLPGRRTCAARP